jgi:hypothetical protein
MHLLRHPSTRLLAAIFAGLATGHATRADSPPAAEGVIAVSSKVSRGYVRKPLPDGTLPVETYAFGEGGKWAGEISDVTLDRLKFIDVARVIALPLAGRNYLPAKDPKAAKLLIMVYWGTTAVPAPPSESIALSKASVAQANLNKFLVRSNVDPRQKVVAGGPAADAAMDQMSSAIALLNQENAQRERTDFANAQMLGYDSPGLIGTERGNYVRGTVLGRERDQLYAEIEGNRYFVVLMAYDFQVLWKQHQHVLLWETRFSISEERNAFDRALPLMAQHAAQYFGKASGGLIRERAPEGKVEIGDPSLIEFISEPKK